MPARRAGEAGAAVRRPAVWSQLGPRTLKRGVRPVMVAKRAASASTALSMRTSRWSAPTCGGAGWGGVGRRLACGVKRGDSPPAVDRSLLRRAPSLVGGPDGLGPAARRGPGGRACSASAAARARVASLLLAVPM